MLGSLTKIVVNFIRFTIKYGRVLVTFSITI